MFTIITSSKTVYFLRAVFLVFVHALSLCSTVKSLKFVKYSEKVLTRDEYQRFTVSSSVLCCSLCFEEVSCESVSFDNVTMECNLTRVPNLAVRSVANSQSHSHVFGKEGKS